MSASVYNLEDLSAECLINSLKNCKPSVIPSVPKVYELLYSQIKKKIESKNLTKILYNKLFSICLKIRKKTGINLGKYIFSSVQKGFGGKVKFMCSAGSPMPEEVANFYYGTGFNMLITYGATETNIPTVGNYGKKLSMSSCGRNYPDVKIKIAENGELLIKSPYMMEGYFNDEISTKEAFNEESWFLSGDLARINQEGNIEILGRCKENIVLATGKKVAPDDIESNYQDIPFVKDFTVCGIPATEGSYDEVHCFVVANMEHREQIEKTIKDKSSQRSKIAKIHFVDSIPRSALKKPKRFLLIIIILIENEQVQVIKQKPKTVKEVVYYLLAEIAKINVSEIEDNTKILQELPIDSLSTIELSLELEKIYDVKLERFINKNTTIKSLIEMIENPPITPTEKIKQYLTKYPIIRKDIDYKIFKFYSNLLKKIYKVTVKEDEILPENTGYIVCANHVSNFDYLYLTANFHKDRFKKFYCVAKQELFTRNPINKLFVRVAGMIPVERTGIAADTIRKVSERIKEKSGVMIFPEGTRSKTGKLGECKKGAAMISLENNVPIIPAYIEGAYEISPPNRKFPKLYNWKQKRKYEVNVIYGKPIFPKGKSIEEITKEVNNAILELSYKFTNKKAVLV